MRTRKGWARRGGASFKTIVYGGAPMYLADIRRALQAMGPIFVQIYGQGETPMVGTVLSRRHLADSAHPRHLDRLASVGVAQTPVQVRVADAQGRSVAAGEIGEVLVRGDTVMAGYWRDPEATAAAVRDGWLWTGDIGLLDEDGFLTLKDRSKDMVISGGSNIYPREVEEVLLMAPGVAEVASWARPIPSGARSSSPSSSRSRDCASTKPRSTRSASIASPASSGPSATCSSMRCRRTTTARC